MWPEERTSQIVSLVSGHSLAEPEQVSSKQKFTLIPWDVFQRL
jgi:hypothetical protein